MSELNRSSEQHSASEIRKKLAAIDAAIDSLVRVGSPVPNSISIEKYTLSRELASVVSSSLVAPDDVSSGGAGNAFVIMPFKDPFNAYYREVIAPTVSSKGYNVTRSDEIFSPGAFVQTIWTEILASDVVIAEMTGSNPNVMYELGLCHAIDRKVVMITQVIADVPADLRHMNVIIYDTTRHDWAARLAESLGRMLTYQPRRRERNTILQPSASIDNTELFNQLDSSAREAQARFREQQVESAELQGQLVDARSECDELRLFVNSQAKGNQIGPAIVKRIKNRPISAILSLPETSQTGVSPLEFVYVAEGGFIYGGGSNEENEWLPAFWISKYAVTNAQFVAFLNAVGLQEDHGQPWISLEGSSPADSCRIYQIGTSFAVEQRFANRPVTYVNYYGASAFCEWVGGVLPSSEQWEKAARGTDGRPYPWGSSPPTPEVANIDQEGWPRDVAPISARSKPKGLSPFGMIQAVGNVWHWTSTYYPERNVQAVRGGSFFDYRLGRREVYRFYVQPDGPDFSQGFVVTRRFLELEG